MKKLVHLWSSRGPVEPAYTFTWFFPLERRFTTFATENVRAFCEPRSTNPIRIIYRLGLELLVGTKSYLELLRDAQGHRHGEGSGRVVGDELRADLCAAGRGRRISRQEMRKHVTQHVTHHHGR